jgi:DNA-binding Lrp family transcriptional regulator
VDATDEKLLNLVDSGTIKYTSLAKKLNMSLSTVHFRLKKLEKDKVIKRYKGEIDWKKAGLPIMAFVLVNIRVNALKGMHKTQDMILKELISIPYVKEGYIVTGDADILVRVMAKDTAHFKDILLNHIDAIDGVANANTIVVLD